MMMMQMVVVVIAVMMEVLMGMVFLRIGVDGEGGDETADGD